MICRYDYLHRYPTVFLKMTGLRLNEFADLLDDMLPRFASAEQTRLRRATRHRAPGVVGMPAWLRVIKSCSR